MEWFLASVTAHMHFELTWDAKFFAAYIAVLNVALFKELYCGVNAKSSIARLVMRRLNTVTGRESFRPPGRGSAPAPGYAYNKTPISGGPPIRGGGSAIRGASLFFTGPKPKPTARPEDFANFDQNWSKRRPKLNIFTKI